MWIQGLCLRLMPEAHRLRMAALRLSTVARHLPMQVCRLVSAAPAAEILTAAKAPFACFPSLICVAAQTWVVPVNGSPRCAHVSTGRFVAATAIRMTMRVWLMVKAYPLSTWERARRVVESPMVANAVMVSFAWTADPPAVNNALRVARASKSCVVVLKTTIRSVAVTTAPTVTSANS